MKTFLHKIYLLIPFQRKKQLPYFLTITLLNTFLDFISIAILVPYILLFFEKEKILSHAKQYFPFDLTDNMLLLGLALLVLFFILKNILQSKIIHKKSKYMFDISSDLSEELLNSFLKIPYVLQIKQEQGTILRDYQRLTIIYSNHILVPLYVLFSESLIVIIIILISLLLNPIVTLTAIAFLSLSMYILLRVRDKKTDFLNHSIAATFKDLINHLMNIYGGYLQIKGAKAEAEFIQKFSAYNREHNYLLSILTNYKQSNIKYLELIVIIGFCLLLLTKGYYGNDFINLVLLSFFISAVIKLLPSINNIITSIIDIKSNKHSVDILFKHKCQIISEENNFNDYDIIKLSNIIFHYNKKQPLLNNLSIDIIKGDFIRINGNSGVGKTTLLKIMTGLLPVKSGNYFVDNIEVKNPSFIKFVNFVPQEPFVFQGTLLDNLTMLKIHDIDIDFIMYLLDVFDLKTWFNSLKDGLETTLLLDSKSISGGQKQRIALIRALYTKPKLLLLDEATNQIDEKLEDKILDYLKSLTETESLTIIAVSHSDIIDKYCTKHIEL